MLLDQGALAFEAWTGRRAPPGDGPCPPRRGLSLTEPAAAGTVRLAASDTMSSRLGDVLQKRGT